MSGLKPITVNTDPAAEAHIYAEDDAAIYQSIVGSDGVMSIGQQCASQVISNNKVRIKDGVLVVGGHFARIPYGDYIDCEIANGQSGRNRNDIIVAKFVTTGSGGIDTYTCEVKQGSSTTGTATDPALTQNDLYQAGKIREMPLYRVKIEGLSIVKVEQMFDLIPTIPQLYAANLIITEETIGPFSVNNENAITENLVMTPPPGYKLALPIMGQTGSRYVFQYSCVPNSEVENGYIIQISNFSGFNASGFKPKMYFLCKRSD